MKQSEQPEFTWRGDIRREGGGGHCKGRERPAQSRRRVSGPYLVRPPSLKLGNGINGREANLDRLSWVKFRSCTFESICV